MKNPLTQRSFSRVPSHNRFTSLPHTHSPATHTTNRTSSIASLRCGKAMIAVRCKSRHSRKLVQKSLHFSTDARRSTNKRCHHTELHRNLNSLVSTTTIPRRCLPSSSWLHVCLVCLLFAFDVHRVRLLLLLLAATMLMLVYYYRSPVRFENCTSVDTLHPTPPRT